MQHKALRHFRLFEGLNEEEITRALACLGARQKQFAKGEYLMLAGDPTRDTVLIVTGSALVIREDYWGNRSVLSVLGAGDLLAEALSGADGHPLSVSVQAAESTQALYLNIQNFMDHHCNHCTLKAHLNRAMLDIIIADHQKLLQKIEDSNQRSTRAKLMSYLSRQALTAGSNSFRIPFNRQALADYLGVDRSAMSKEMSLMAREGLIAYQRSEFQLLKGAG